MGDSGFGSWAHNGEERAAEVAAASLGYGQTGRVFLTTHRIYSP